MTAEGKRDVGIALGCAYRLHEIMSIKRLPPQKGSGYAINKCSGRGKDADDPIGPDKFFEELGKLIKHLEIAYKKA